MELTHLLITEGVPGMRVNGVSTTVDGQDYRGTPEDSIQRHTQHVQAHLHGIAWLMCVRLGKEFDSDSLFGLVWTDVLGNNYFDGHQIKWVATMLNPLADITRPASL